MDIGKFTEHSKLALESVGQTLLFHFKTRIQNDNLLALGQGIAHGSTPQPASHGVSKAAYTFLSIFFF